MKFLRLQRVQRDEVNAAAAFECVAAVILISEAELERAKEETSESALLSRGAMKRLVLEKVLEKGLSQILGIGLLVAGSPQIGVDGRPIDAAQFFQSIARFAAGICSGVANQRPAGRSEQRVLGNRRWHEVVLPNAKRIDKHRLTPGGRYWQPRNVGGSGLG